VRTLSSWEADGTHRWTYELPIPTDPAAVATTSDPDVLAITMPAGMLLVHLRYGVEETVDPTADDYVVSCGRGPLFRQTVSLQAAGGRQDFVWATPAMVGDLCDMSGARVEVAHVVAGGRPVPPDFGPARWPDPEPTPPADEGPADRWVISMDSNGRLHGTGPAD
jgi:hypothetical protein